MWLVVLVFFFLVDFTLSQQADWSKLNIDQSLIKFQKGFLTEK
jgi:hypothetical protein